MYPLTMTFPFIDLPEQHFVKGYENTLMLTEDRIWRNFKADVTETNNQDRDMPWQERRIDWRISSTRNNIAAIELHRCSDAQLYKIIISISGAVENINLFFVDQKDAEKIYALLQDWYYQKGISTPWVKFVAN